MKTARKSLLVALCAILLVVASVMGTLAYLTDTEAVTNTFTVGKIGITLDEAPVDEDGKAVEGDRVQANEYHLIPGSSYDKDPTVHVDDNSENAWLFVMVENGIADIEAGNTIAAQMANLGWTPVAEGSNIFYYKDVVSANDDIIVFKTFTIKGDADVAAYTDAEINITAYAVQAENFDTAAAAWAATFGA